MRRASLLASFALLLLACGGGATAPLGQLERPVAVAVHQASNQVFVANHETDELKVFDPTKKSGGSFVLGPSVLFALSIPTVPAPAALGAADRFVFVLSRDAAEVGFVDLALPGAFGPRSVDGPDGFPITQALPFSPAALAALSTRFPATPGGTGDHALVAGLNSGVGGALVAVRPPGEDGRPSLVGRIELPEGFPSDVAIEPPATTDAADPADDCRAVAVADNRFDGGGTYEPGIWLTRVATSADGALRLEAPGTTGAGRLTIHVPLLLLDGTVAMRAAPVRAISFVPAPLDDTARAAAAADPCALRSGRLVAVLDEGYCRDADLRTCPDVAIVDLPSGLLAGDLASGPALYAIPGSALGVEVITGSFAPVRSFAPVVPEGATAAEALEGVPALALVTSSDGGVYYFAPGLGTYLVGPTAADRAVPDPAFALDADAQGPRVTAPVRTDARRRAVPLDPPVIELLGAKPRDEIFSAGFQAPFPGLGDLPPVPGLVNQDVPTVTVAPGAEATFLAPIPVRIEADPALSDRIVPLAGTVPCRGYPITSVSADGRSVTVSLVEQPEAICRDPGLVFGVVPSEATPWWLEGSVTGFIGRLPPAGAEVWGGDALLFTFVPPEFPDPSAAAGAAWSFTTDAGFAFYAAVPDTDFQFPADIDAWIRTPATATAPADWRVFVPYTGGDGLIQFDPEVPPPLAQLRAYQ